MESVNVSGTGNSPRALPVVTLGEVESNHGRKSISSSSSSASSSSGLVIGLEDDDAMQVETPEDEKDTQIDSDNMDDDFRDNSLPLNEPHSPDSSPTQSPPAQVMERPTDSPAYRIPSSVFARTKSSAPMEWSVTSNESLFSIQMGNMSFTRDHVNWVGKSGELICQGDSNFPSPKNAPLIDMSSNYQPTAPSKHKPAELGQKNNVGTVSFGLTETKAEETMREVIKENEENHSKEKGQKTACNSPSLNRSSDASGASTKSFVFPILTGDEKSSRHAKSRGNSQPPTPKVAQQTQTDPHSQTQQLQTSKTENAPKKSQSFFGCKWFSCFPCCSNCS